MPSSTCANHRPPCRGIRSAPWILLHTVGMERLQRMQFDDVLAKHADSTADLARRKLRRAWNHRGSPSPGPPGGAPRRQVRPAGPSLKTKLIHRRVALDECQSCCAPLRRIVLGAQDHHRDRSLSALLIRRVPGVPGVGRLPGPIALLTFGLVSYARNLAMVRNKQSAPWVCF